MPAQECECLRSGPLAGSKATTYLGIDPTDGRFAEVEIEECTFCRRTWLHYQIEIGGDPQVIRSFRGLVDRSLLTRITPETAVEVLESLPWRLRAGGPLGPEGIRETGPVDLER